jgi:hypothetical protein
VVHPLPGGVAGPGTLRDRKQRRDNRGRRGHPLRDASGAYADDLKTTGVPESFLVDPEGNLVSRFPGPFRNLAEIEEFAAPALEDAGAAGGAAR